MISSKEKALIAVNSMEEKKGEDVRIIKIDAVSTLADYFIIAGGSNRNQIQAMADEIEEKLAEKEVTPKHIEGYMNGSWILMDYGDVVIHIFDAENRALYDLERIWRDGITMEKSELE